MFWCAAMLRARGLAFTRPPSPPVPALALAGAAGGVATGLGAAGTGGVWAADETEAG